MKQNSVQSALFPETQPKIWETKGIFSDHYIRTRLKESTFWPKEEEIKTLYEYCRNLWDNVSRFLGQKSNEASTRKELIDKIVEKLGFSYIPNITFPVGHKQEPDYILYTDEATKNSVLDKNTSVQYSVAISLIEAKRFKHPLGTMSKHETPGRYPHQQIRDYLQSATDQSGKSYFNWAILTNGNIWRLYCRNAHPDSYFEFNFGVGIYSLEHFSLFVALFRLSAFIKDSEGKCPLDDIREQALHCKTELEADLRKRIFTILKQLANGFYSRPENKINKDNLNELYGNCLIFLYRLLFILYAEGKGLLPVKQYGAGANKDYRERYSLQRLFPRLKNPLEFQSEELTDLYEDMLKLFRLINGDQPSRNKAFDVPLYNGGLFNPKKYPLLEEWRIGEKTLGNVLRRLIATKIPKGIGEQESFDFGDTVDYADLEVRQLGSIYEGLLENHLELESENLLLKEGKTNGSHTLYGCEGIAQLVLKGDKTERKATGTYYTPDYIVQYIVDNTLEPLCKEIEKSPEVQNAREKKLEDNSFARAVLKLNILDPAMGSGHFLVRAVEFLADQIVYHPTTALQNEKVSPGLSQQQEETAYWRRRVVESCIYGVDLNPLAVELAKLSLWLTCISTKRPLNFLDHHLRPGNSLISAKINELGNLPTKEELPLFAPDLKKAVSSAIQKLKSIEEAESKDIPTIKKKESYWQEVRNNLKPYREVADLWTSAFFEIKINEIEYQKLAKLIIQKPEPRTKEAKKLKEKLALYKSAFEIANKEMFFHWEYEFPEVFFNEDGTSKDNIGFDAVIGNPPWIESKFLEPVFKSYFVINFPTMSGQYDIFNGFVELGGNILSKTGFFGMILPNRFCSNPDYQCVRKYLFQKYNYLSIRDYGDGVFPKVNMPSCILIGNPSAIRNTIHITNSSGISFDLCISEVIKQAGLIIRIDTTPLIEILIKKCQELSASLQTFYYNARGVEIGKDSLLIVDIPTPNTAQFGIGENLSRYSFEPQCYLRLDDSNIDYKNKSLYMGNKIIIRKTGHGINATVDTSEAYVIQVIYILKGKPNSKIDNLYTLALLNSNLIYHIYYALFGERQKKTFPHIRQKQFLQLPIRRIAFVTLEKERQGLIEKLKAKVEEEKFGEVLKIVEECLPKDEKGNFIIEKEKSDIVHDLLAFLAEQMIEMNKEKQKLIREFLSWLEREITKVSIESLNNKTKIKEFYEYNLDTLLEVLKQNHILVEVLDFGDKRYKALKKAFDTTMSQLAPLKKKIKATDKELIDQLVYKLYGLTEEEIKIVEGEK